MHCTAETGMAPSCCYLALPPPHRDTCYRRLVCSLSFFKDFCFHGTLTISTWRNTEARGIHHGCESCTVTGVGIKALLIERQNLALIAVASFLGAAALVVNDSCRICSELCFLIRRKEMRQRCHALKIRGASHLFE